MSFGGRQVASGDEFRSLGANYSQRASELESLTGFLQTQVNSAMWDGAAAMSFRDEWTMHKANLDRLRTSLESLSTELRTVRAPLADELNRRG
jgi:uncharacterized protein YukE